VSANADLARRAIVAAAARDIATMREMIADDFRIQASQAIIGGFAATGLAKLDGAYDELRAYPDTVRDAPGDVVWIRGAVVTRAKGEKTTKARLVNWVLVFAGGKIAALTSFDDEQESLKAAGLT
jgi:hypothetical protein